MKDKIQICNTCGNQMKYKGHRIFVCKTCKKSIYVLRPEEG